MDLKKPLEKTCWNNVAWLELVSFKLFDNRRYFLTLLPSIASRPDSLRHCDASKRHLFLASDENGQEPFQCFQPDFHSTEIAFSARRTLSLIFIYFCARSVSCKLEQLLFPGMPFSRGSARQLVIRDFVASDNLLGLGLTSERDIRYIWKLSSLSLRGDGIAQR